MYCIKVLGKLSTLKRATLSILFFNITISADTAWRQRKKNRTDLFEEYFKEGNLFMKEGVIM